MLAARSLTAKQILEKRKEINCTRKEKEKERKERKQNQMRTCSARRFLGAPGELLALSLFSTCHNARMSLSRSSSEEKRKRNKSNLRCFVTAALCFLNACSMKGSSVLAPRSFGIEKSSRGVRQPCDYARSLVVSSLCLDGLLLDGDFLYCYLSFFLSVFLFFFGIHFCFAIQI
jgi:hypothetical protein